jgi:hypothetical protein
VVVALDAWMMMTHYEVVALVSSSGSKPLKELEKVHIGCCHV